MKIVSIILSALLLCAKPIQAAVMVGFGSATSGAHASDNFNRADGAIGSNWDSQSGVAQSVIVSNAVTSTGAVLSVAIWKYTVNAFSANQKSCVYIDTTADSYGPIVRASTSEQTYYYLINSGGSLLMRKRINGTPTTIGTYSQAAAGSTLCISASGTSITASVNGSGYSPVTDSAISSGQPGLFAYTTSGKVDLWTGDDI